MEIAITVFLSVLAIYFLIGLVFAIIFLFGGASRVDPLMADSKRIVRLLLFPGCIAVWPFMISKMFKAKRS